MLQSESSLIAESLINSIVTGQNAVINSFPQFQLLKKVKITTSDYNWTVIPAIMNV